MEGVQLPGGTPLDLDAASVERNFARAMAEDSPSDLPAPPKREAAADDKPKRGRPPKTATRTTTSAAAPKPKPKGTQEPAKLEPKDFGPDLTAITDGIWLAASQIPVAVPYAAILKGNQAGLVSALNQAANQNSTVRNYVEKLTGGGGNSWMMSLGMVGVSMAMQGMQMARDPEVRTQVIKANSAAVHDYLQQLSGQMAEADAD